MKESKKREGIIIIPDERLKQIPTIDNGEKLVNIADRCPNIIINLNPKRRKKEKLPETACHVRESVAMRLNKAQALLPEGYKLMIWESFRPLTIQQEFRNALFEKLKSSHPEWTENKVKSELDKFLAPIDIIPPHSTGGAVDLTIMNAKGEIIDMGSQIHSFSEKSYTNCEDISEKAKRNRRMLIEVMDAAGFVNYPTEWWHWSYGDRYWAIVTKNKTAVYGNL